MKLGRRVEGVGGCLTLDSNRIWLDERLKENTRWKRENVERKKRGLSHSGGKRREKKEKKNPAVLKSNKIRRFQRILKMA